MPDSVLHVCATKLYYFYDITKPWLQNVYDEIEIVCVCLLDTLKK